MFSTDYKRTHYVEKQWWATNVEQHFADNEMMCNVHASNLHVPGQGVCLIERLLQVVSNPFYHFIAILWFVKIKPNLNSLSWRSKDATQKRDRTNCFVNRPVAWYAFIVNSTMIIRDYCSIFSYDYPNLWMCEENSRWPLICHCVAETLAYQSVQDVNRSVIVLCRCYLSDTMQISDF